MILVPEVVALAVTIGGVVAQGGLHAVAYGGVAAVEAALAGLAAGSGLDDTHRELLAAMNQEKAPMRNTDSGYWIRDYSRWWPTRQRRVPLYAVLARRLTDPRDSRGVPLLAAITHGSGLVIGQDREDVSLPVRCPPSIRFVSPFCQSVL